VENLAVDVLYVEGKAASIDLPSSVQLKVTESAEGVRGVDPQNAQEVMRRAPAGSRRAFRPERHAAARDALKPFHV